MKSYTDAELALFAQYESIRIAFTPKECHGGDGCWVHLGPPGYSNSLNGMGGCVGCGGLPGKRKSDRARKSDHALARRA